MAEKQRPIYARRRVLRSLERIWTRLERGINRVATAGVRIRPYNPLYHLGTLAIFLLIVLTVTGIYLTIFYRPGTDRAYQSVALISANWVGSLMRSVHRYASDALILVTLLHALKTFLSDRFWGSRWLAWLSGWIMLVLFWLLGLMGYWLVWDEAAQWLTNYFIGLFRGPLAYTFLGGDIRSATFSLFVIVLFLHVFVPVLLLVGVLVHVLRLSRAKYWAPKWVMVTAVIALILIAIAQPAASTLPADLDRLVQSTEIDWWYLGFLPLIQRLGNPVFWLMSWILLGVAMALPWLARGQDEGPAFVIEPNCTGCAVCAQECPYEAIEMVHRDDESGYDSIAVVSPNKCTGCGICVGACPYKAIELERLHSAVMRQDLNRELGRAQYEGQTAVTIFACERHNVMGTLPPLTNATPAGVGIGGTIPLLQAKLPPRVNVGTWPDSQGRPHPVLTCVVPCTGTLHPTWAAETIDAGGAGAIVVSCPAHDCAYREGPHWIAKRLVRRRTLRKGNTHFLEVAPGSHEPVVSLWAKMVGDEVQAAQARQAATEIGIVGKTAAEAETPSKIGQLRYWGAGFVVLLLAFVLSVLPLGGATAVYPQQAQIQLVINHGGKIMATSNNLSQEILDKLPDNVDPIQVLGGERFPVHLRLVVDGDTVLEETYEPRGLRHEGAIYGLENYWLAPGKYAVQVWLMDDETEWRLVFDEMVEVGEGQVINLQFDEGEGVFAMRE